DPGRHVGRRQAGDARDSGSGRLLREVLVRLSPRFSKLAGANLELLLQSLGRIAPVSRARFQLRSGRTKLATSRVAFCAFERQGHLVGTVTGPRPVSQVYQS